MQNGLANTMLNKKGLHMENYLLFTMYLVDFSLLTNQIVHIVFQNIYCKKYAVNNEV